MVLVEVARKSYLASIVPVIVNAILNDHQIVVDIVAFVNKGDFPRSRLGEKQRGKILASWVTRKMRTMAQFGIRDPDGGLSDVMEEPHSRHGSLRNSNPVSSSLRNVDIAPQILEQREAEHQATQQHQRQQQAYNSLPTGISEMPTESYENSIQESPPMGQQPQDRDDTPTNATQSHFELPASGAPHLDPIPAHHSFETERMQSGLTDYDTPTFATAREPPDVPPSRVPAMPPRLNLPAVEGREGDLWSLPSQRGTLGVVGGIPPEPYEQEDEMDWPQEAIMHMNLGGDGQHSRQSSRSYRM